MDSEEQRFSAAKRGVLMFPRQTNKIRIFAKSIKDLAQESVIDNRQRNAAIRTNAINHIATHSERGTIGHVRPPRPTRLVQMRSHRNHPPASRVGKAAQASVTAAAEMHGVWPDCDRFQEGVGCGEVTAATSAGLGSGRVAANNNAGRAA